MNAEDWIILRTKSNRERSAATFLESKGIACFLPARKAGARMARRPPPPAAKLLFPGYLFVQPGGSELVGFRYVPGTCGWISFGGKPAALTQGEIDRIGRIVDSDLPVQNHGGLHRGVPIRVRQGPLAGLEGEFVRMKGSGRFVVNLTLLGQSISVEMEGNSVCPLGDPGASFRE